MSPKDEFGLGRVGREKPNLCRWGAVVSGLGVTLRLVGVGGSEWALGK